MSYQQPKPFDNQHDVNEYINHDKIQCLICGKRYSFLPVHLHRKHNISADEYKQMFNINTGTPLAGLSYREKHRQKIKQLQADGKLTYEHLSEATELARNADRNRTDYQKNEQKKLIENTRPWLVNQLPPNSKRADGRDADNAREYQRKYRDRKK